jgi:hypothetical protein
MNYRGVVVRGTARLVDELDEHLEALRLVSDHVVATWDTGRAPTELEIRKTIVIAVPLVEMSAKIRTGDPIDEPEDLDGPHWGGHVPIRSVWERAVRAQDLPDGIDVPPAIASLDGRAVCVATPSRAANRRS